jgi:SOS response associated peptidase (SRAP)
MRTASAAALYRWTASSSGGAIKGQKAKQPYAIAMKDGAPFGIAGIWENWKEPASGEWIRTFAIITTDANELVADIHDRMPVILAPVDYARWLDEEPDPRDLMRPFPAELMRMWPISTRVNKPENTIRQWSNRSRSQRMPRSAGASTADAAAARVRHRNTAVYNSVVALATKSPIRITSPACVSDFKTAGVPVGSRQLGFNPIDISAVGICRSQNVDKFRSGATKLDE